MNHNFDLQRFVDAQAHVYEQVCRELRAGRKTLHWMWFIFPQIAGLRNSPRARRYAISGRDEMLAYAEHPSLGERLRECTRIVSAVTGRAHEIFGSPDDAKFRSSMTLFEAALDKYFSGECDPLTTALL